MHQSFLKRFPLFIWLLFAVSSVSNFRLTQAGGGDLLFRFSSSVQSCCREGGALQADSAVCGEHSPCSSHTGFAPYRGVCAFPVYTAQAPGCSIWSVPCVECGSSFRVLHKSADSVAPAFCVFPGLSGSGSQRLGRPLPRCGAPFPSAASSSGSQRLGPTLPRFGAPSPSAASGPGSQRLGRPLPRCSVPFLFAASRSGSQRLGRTFPGCGAPLPSAALACAASRVSGSL